MKRIEEIERAFRRPKSPAFDVGDTVDVHVKIVDAGKERVQIFGGTVISRRGGGLGEMFTVRRMVAGEGVERIFPLHSPRIAAIKVRRKGRVRRAKLFYLRDRVGRAMKVPELAESQTATEAAEAPPAGAPAPEAKAEKSEAAEAAVKPEKPEKHEKAEKPATARKPEPVKGAAKAS